MVTSAVAGALLPGVGRPAVGVARVVAVCVATEARGDGASDTPQPASISATTSATVTASQPTNRRATIVSSYPALYSLHIQRVPASSRSAYRWLLSHARLIVGWEEWAGRGA